MDSVLRSESRGAEIKLPPGAGAEAEITNCGSGKMMIAKEGFVNYHNFNLIWVQHASAYVKKYWYSHQKR
jgi:hypothetical protein